MSDMISEGQIDAWIQMFERLHNHDLCEALRELQSLRRANSWIKVTPETMPTNRDSVLLAIPTHNLKGEFLEWHYEVGWREETGDPDEPYNFATEGDESYEVEEVSHYRPIAPPTGTEIK